MTEIQDDDWREFTISTEVAGTDGGSYWLELEGTEYGSGDEEWTAEISGDPDVEVKVTDLDPWPEFLPRLKMQPLKKFGPWNLAG